MLSSSLSDNISGALQTDVSAKSGQLLSVCFTSDSSLWCSSYWTSYPLMFFFFFISNNIVRALYTDMSGKNRATPILVMSQLHLLINGYRRRPDIVLMNHLTHYSLSIYNRILGRDSWNEMKWNAEIILKLKRRWRKFMVGGGDQDTSVWIIPQSRSIQPWN